MATGSGRLIAIGDVHGCVHALDALLEVIAPTQTDELVFLGDLVDQGRDSSRCWIGCWNWSAAVAWW